MSGSLSECCLVPYCEWNGLALELEGLVGLAINSS